MSTQIPGTKQGAGCWKIGLISCAVVSVLLIGSLIVVGFLGFRFFAKDPDFKNMMTCGKQLHEVNAAIERYHVRNGSYPQNLNQLAPTFLADPANLHCPADTAGANGISYLYTAPPAGAPSEFVVLKCAKHSIKGKPVTLRVQKDGKFANH